mmetsp:Transcript_94270/g.249144  ORF Transcript_94270/g.249144 Transcript_94270/m.249144 type:complete len:431 (-) Transcript_94270:3-1295(-)
MLSLLNGVLEHGATVLGDDDAAFRLVHFLDVLAHLPHAPWHDTPVHVRALPPRIVDELNLLILEVAAFLDVAPHRNRLRRTVRGLGVRRRVVVQSEELRGALDHLLLLLRERRQAVAAALLHALGVVALPDGVRIPTQLPIQSPLGRGLVLLRRGQWLTPVHVQSDSDHTLLLGLELVPVQDDGLRVSEDDVVRRQIWLSVGLLLPARGHLAVGVAQHGGAPRLVESDPIGHFVAELLEADLRVVLKVIDDLPVEPTAVLVLQALGQVPMVERDQRPDVVRDQLVDESCVELDGLRVDLATALGQEPGPRDGEPVCGETQLFHEFHVLLKAMVVVARHCSTVAVLHLARRRAERIPNARRATSLSGGALDLVGCSGGAPHETLGEGQLFVLVHGGGRALHRGSHGAASAAGAARQPEQPRAVVAEAASED